MLSWLLWWRKMNMIRNSKVNLKIKWMKYFIKLILWLCKFVIVVCYIFFNIKWFFDFCVIYYFIKVKFFWFCVIWWFVMSGLWFLFFFLYKVIWLGIIRGRFRYIVWFSWLMDRFCKVILKVKNIVKGK